MSERAVRIALTGERTVTGIWTELDAGSPTDWAVIYAPGAGATVADGFGRFAGQALAEAKIPSLRIQFPYMEEHRRLPDRPAVLEATWRSAVAAARDRSARLVIGGRSMGGRIASQVVAAEESVAALALFAYPLHPPGQPERMRDAHLDRIGVPTLFCSGTRDAFATPDELRRAAALVPRSTIHLLESADHGFRAAKASGRTQRDIWAEAVQSLVDWLPRIETPGA